VKQANFIVLRSIKMPSVLIEGAFLSNRKDEKLIRKESVLRSLADATTEGIFRFFEKYPPTDKQVALSTRIVHVVMSGETLWGIAKKYDVTVDQIRSYNDLGGRSVIKPGQKLRIYR
jgi:N-acetylmuramoyl-L-alanine amidase